MGVCPTACSGKDVREGAGAGVGAFSPSEPGPEPGSEPGPGFGSGFGSGVDVVIIGIATPGVAEVGRASSSGSRVVTTGSSVS